MKLPFVSPKAGLTQIILLLALFPSLFVSGQGHPRLLADADDLPELREKITREPYAAMVAELTAFAEADTTAGVQYGETVAAVNCGFLYLLTGDDSWAAKARTYAEGRLADTSSSHGWNRDIKGLALYWHGRGIALAYDFCFDAPSWNTAAGTGSNPSEPFVDYVRLKLKGQADRIYLDGGKEQNLNVASNWQNNRFASAGLIYLAIEEVLTESERERIAGCLDRVGAYLSENMGNSPDSRGYNIESIGYQMYPWSFTGPFAIAAERLGYGRLGDVAPAAAAYALWNVYSSALRIPHLWGDHFGIHLDFGDDNNAHRGEGTYGLAFYFCPEFLHPGMRYWYDRIVGELGDQTWDRERGGLIYSILYYRDDIEPVHPDLIKEWRNAYLETGGNGYFTFRNTYAAGEEIMAQLYAKFRGNKGHSGPDALSFRIAGLDAPFAVGGGRYGPDINAADTGKKQDAYLRSMNTLYPVDPANELSISGKSGSLLGTPQLFSEGGGTVSLHISQNNVGTNNHTRRFLADYSEESGAKAVYVISDTSDDGNWWQFCQVDLDPVEAAISVDGNTFTVTNPNGSFLTGTVIYPEGNLNWETGTRIRGSDYFYYGERYDSNEFVHFQSGDGDYLVVLTVNEAGATAPSVTALSGVGANGQRVLEIGNLRVAVDGDAIGRGDDVPIPPAVVVMAPEYLLHPGPGTAELNVDGRAFSPGSPIDVMEVYYGPVSEYLGDAGLNPLTGDFSFTLPGLSLGEHLFRVKAVNTEGIARYSNYLPLSVLASEPPVITIDYPEDRLVLERNAIVSLEFDINDPDPDGGITTVELKLNGVPQSLAATGPWTIPLNTTLPGSLLMEWSATDTSGETTRAAREVFVNTNELPEPWVHFDIGAVGAGGTASMSGDTLTLEGSGSDIWSDADEFHFAFQTFDGSGEVITRVTALQNTHQWAKAGPMIRGSASAGSAYAGLFITPVNGITLQGRAVDGGSSSSQSADGVTAPVWLRLVRSGDTFTGYYRKTTSDAWEQVGSFAIETGPSSLAGIAGTSHSDGTLMTASFNPVQFISAPVPPSPELSVGLAGAGFQVEWLGHPDYRQQLEISPDLKHWAPMGDPNPTGITPSSMELEGIPAPFYLRVLSE